MAKKQKSLIVKSNQVVEACYQLTLAEKRILLTLISRLDSRDDPPPLDLRHVIRAAELAELFKLPSKQAYALIREGAERLAERWLIVPPEPGMSPHTTHGQIRWLAGIWYRPSEGCIALTLSPDILPYLTQLRQTFTPYRLQHVAPLTTVYAIRLYELMVQWRGVGVREMEIAWLKERFQLVGQYASLKDFKRRVIDPAVEQINQHTDLWLKYAQRKQGRQVVAFIFTFGEKPTAAPDTARRTRPANPGRIPLDEWLRTQARPGESDAEATARYRREQSAI